MYSRRTSCLAWITSFISRPLATSGRRQLATKTFHNVVEDEVFSYRAQRWLWREAEQLRRRYVKFNLQALQRACETAVGTDMRCTEITRLPEGNFNKTFMMTMRSGAQIIARVANPNAGHPHYTIASEVATMDYVRTRLDIPIPKVLGYETNASSNDVGAEYIIMEKCPGVELSHVWKNFTGRQKAQIVQQLAYYQVKMFQAKLPCYGSIYYAKDIPIHESTKIDDNFVIGPTTSRSWFDGRRGELGISRGPWEITEEVLSATAEREMNFLDKFADLSTEHQQGIFRGPDGYHPTKAFKKSVLRDFLKILPYLSPQDDMYTAPILWHKDLHADNIFVDSDDPTRITGIIDWQGVHVHPSFLQVRLPSLIEYEGPILDDHEQAKLPSDFAELSDAAQKAARALFLAQTLWSLHKVCVHQECPDLHRTLQYQDTLPAQIMRMTGSISDDGEPYLQDLIATAAEPDIWQEIVANNGKDKAKTVCPLKYTEDERATHQIELMKWKRDIERKARIFEDVGAYSGWDGAVQPDEFEEVAARLERAKQKFLDAEARTEEGREQWLTVWPFADKR